MWRGVLIALALAAAVPAQDGPGKLYNTAKQKLMAGKPLTGATVYSPDPNMYCAGAEFGLRFHVDRDAAQPADV
jgi:hypothetical protein